MALIRGMATYKKMKDLNKEKIILLLRPYFEQRADILMAFLFGSWAADRTCAESDVDVAVYFKPESGRLEWDDPDARYEAEAAIWLDVERMLGSEVDLLVLNRAAASIAGSTI